MARPLSICYAAPGHRLVSTAGTARNMLSLTDALSQYAEVTLAFRRADADVAGGHRVLAIEPGGDDENAVDDVARLGLNPILQVAYLRRLGDFAHRWRPAFDIVLEKSWRLSGALASAFRRRGAPGVLVENDVRWWSEPIRDVRTLGRYGMHIAAAALARRYRRRLPIIAETEELKTMLVGCGARAAQVEVIGLGVDHRLFRPQEQAQARRALGIDPAALVLTYVGAMDRYHDLTPVIAAMAGARVGVELHVVGDGTGRSACEQLAAGLAAAVRFHGRVPHAHVPTFIAAADAGLVAYREQAFPGDVVPFSTLKVPEYMACARPVIGNAAGEARRLLEHGISGLLFANNVASWQAFLADLPDRERLADMGRAAAKAGAALTWERTAARYVEVCERLVAAGGRR
jgi:glycosyltransferase involved in cell wall biosynthesis